MKYYGIMPIRKLWVKIAVIIFAVFVLYSSIVSRSIYSLPFGIIMILATFSDRKHVISDSGIDILYTVCGKRFNNIWEWEDIVSIHTDSIKSRPNIELHISKGVVSRRFIFSSSDTDHILKLAKEMNSAIYIAEIKHN